MAKRKAHPNYAVILFADLVGSARLSDVLDPNEYSHVVDQYQVAASEVLANLNKRLPEALNWDGGIRGDEFVLIMTLTNVRETDRPSDAAEVAAATCALRVAIELKVRWFLAEQNLARINAGATPFGVGIGIHYGPVVLKNRVRGKWEERNKNQRWTWTTAARMAPEGLAINFAKRVEGASRHGTSMALAVSQSFLSLCRRAGLPVFEELLKEAETKGFEQREPIFEIQTQDVIWSADVFKKDDPRPRDKDRLASKLLSQEKLLTAAFRRDPDRMLWLMELALETLFRRGKYAEAVKLGEEAAAVRPGPAMSYRLGRAQLILHAFDRRDPGKAERLAVPCYQEAKARGFDEGELHAMLGYTYHRLARALRHRYAADNKKAGCWLEEARKESEIAIERDPLHFFAHYQKAVVLAEWALVRNYATQQTEEDRRCTVKLVNEATNSVGRAEELNPGLDRGSSLYSLYREVEARICLAKGDTSKARHLANQLKRMPEPKQADHYQPGFARRALRAPRHWRKVLERLDNDINTHGNRMARRGGRPTGLKPKKVRPFPALRSRGRARVGP